MTTSVTDHHGPHLELQRLIHSAAQRGAGRATIHIMPDRLEYQDDTPFRTTIDTSHIEPDGHYTVAWAVSRYPVPDHLHVHVVNHQPWGEHAQGKGHTHLPHVGDDDATPPRTTPSGRYQVRLKTGIGRPMDIMIIDQQGLPVQRADTFGLQTVHAPHGTPGDQLQKCCYRILATPVPSAYPARDPDGNDREEVIDTAHRMFADLVRDAKTPPRTSMLWPDRPTRDALAQLGLDPGVNPEPSARLYPTGTWENPRVLMPHGAVWAQLPRTSGPWILRALVKHPEQSRRYTLIEDPAHADQANLPVLRLIVVTTVDHNGAITHHPVPEVHPDQGVAMTHQPRLEATVMERVRSITAVLEYREPGKPPDRFEADLDAYSDADQENHVVLTTPGLEMDQSTFAETSGMRHHRRTGAFTGPMDWGPRYHARRLTQDSIQTANEEILEDIASALDTIGIRPTDAPTTVTSPSGTITITIAPANGSPGQEAPHP